MKLTFVLTFFCFCVFLHKDNIRTLKLKTLEEAPTSLWILLWFTHLLWTRAARSLLVLAFGLIFLSLWVLGLRAHVFAVAVHISASFVSLRFIAKTSSPFCSAEFLLFVFVVCSCMLQVWHRCNLCAIKCVVSPQRGGYLKFMAAGTHLVCCGFLKLSSTRHRACRQIRGGKNAEGPDVARLHRGPVGLNMSCQVFNPPLETRGAFMRPELTLLKRPWFYHLVTE